MSEVEVVQGEIVGEEPKIEWATQNHGDRFEATLIVNEAWLAKASREQLEMLNAVVTAIDKLARGEA